MAKVSWLHISDTHILRPLGNQDTEEGYQKHILGKFIEFIKNHEWEKSILKPQYFLLTGDLAFSGEKENYVSKKKHSVRKMIDLVASALDIKVKDYTMRVFPVSGNHDVDRKALNKTRESGYLSAEPDDLFGESEKKNRKDILKRFKPYCDFVKELWRLPNSRNYEKYLWYKNSFPVEDSSNKLWIVGINSAWLCHSYWKVYMEGTDQYRDAERTDLLALPFLYIDTLFKGIPEKDLVVVLMHHDYARTRDYSTKVSSLLEDKCDFILYGHEHTETWAQPTLGRAFKVRAGRFYERKNLRNTVNVIQVDVDTREAKMLTIHYRTDKDVWEVERGNDPTKGRWTDRFSFDKATGILNFDLSGAKKTISEHLLVDSGDEPDRPFDFSSIKENITKLTEAERLQRCSEARRVREYLQELHEHASLAASHSGQDEMNIEKRENALVCLYACIDFPPDKIPSFDKSNRAVWCNYLNSFTRSNMSRLALSLANALDEVQACRYTGESEQQVPSPEVSNFSLETVAENSNKIATKIAVDGTADMDECHGSLADLPDKIRTLQKGKNPVGTHEIVDKVKQSSRNAPNVSQLRRDS